MRRREEGEKEAGGAEVQGPEANGTAERQAWNDVGKTCGGKNTLDEKR